MHHPPRPGGCEKEVVLGDDDVGVIIDAQLAQSCLELGHRWHRVGKSGRLVAHGAVEIEGKGSRDMRHARAARGHIDDDDAGGVRALE